MDAVALETIVGTVQTQLFERGARSLVPRVIACPHRKFAVPRLHLVIFPNSTHGDSTRAGDQASAAASAATIGMISMKLTHGFRRKEATLRVLTPCLFGSLEGLCPAFLAAVCRRRLHILSSAPHVPRRPQMPAFGALVDLAL